MKRVPFLMRMDGPDRAAQIEAVRALKPAFEAACADASVENFSVWHMEQYLFGYGESLSERTDCFDAILSALPEGVKLVCAPATEVTGISRFFSSQRASSSTSPR